jgi:hypothetical protein
MTKLKASVYGKLGSAFMLAFGGLLLGAAAKLIAQSIFWLKNGFWQPYSILNLLIDIGSDLPSTPNLLGVQRIIDDVLSWPALVGLGVSAGLCLLIGAYFLVLAEGYEGQLQLEADAAMRAQNERDAQEERHEAAERSRTDFDFAETIEQLRSEKWS